LSVHINQPNGCDNFSSLLLDVFTAQHISGVVIAVLLVLVGPARPRPTALLLPRSEGKTKGCYCSCWAPDDEREDARNML